LGVTRAADAECGDRDSDANEQRERRRRREGDAPAARRAVWFEWPGVDLQLLGNDRVLCLFEVRFLFEHRRQRRRCGRRLSPIGTEERGVDLVESYAAPRRCVRRRWKIDLAGDMRVRRGVRSVLAEECFVDVTGPLVRSRHAVSSFAVAAGRRISW
jgi:hypothetical protein